MTDAEDRANEIGRRSAWVGILQQAGSELGYDTDEGKLAFLLAERERTVAALREICGVHGDNDWPPNLYLPDIINKHLGNYLDESIDDDDGDAEEPVTSRGAT